jgi:hypothetical protein
MRMTLVLFQENCTTFFCFFALFFAQVYQNVNLTASSWPKCLIPAAATRVIRPWKKSYTVRLQAGYRVGSAVGLAKIRIAGKAVS